jgi:acetyl esterase/lipase
MRAFLFLLSVAALAQTDFTPPAGVDFYPNVEYSNVGQRVEMDLFRPKAAVGNLPAVLFVHGGGFRGGRRETYRALAAKLAARGYVTATASYRLAPRHQFPAAVEDVKAAVRFLRANAGRYGIDGERIGAWGASAGGHLVLMLGLTGEVGEFEGTGPNREFSSKVQAVVNYFGPTDFTQSYSKSVDAAVVLPLWIGGHLDTHRKQHQKASPIHWVNPNAAPVLSLHGTEDAYVAYEHSVALTARLLDAGVEAQLMTLAGAGHGFRGEDAERAEAAAFAFLDRQLKPKAVERTILLSDHGPLGEVVAMEWPSGKVLWTRANGRGHDVQSLGGGGVLFTVAPRKCVVELNAKQEEVWTYCEGLEHPLSAQRLANGNTLIGDARTGRLVEVTRDKRVVWEYKAENLANMRMRNSRRTAAGTTLVAEEAIAKIHEVDGAGKVIWTWQAPEGEQRRAYQALRLANGNTLISLSDPGEVVEVNRAGQVVRSVGGKDTRIQFGWASGIAVLSNGNWLISDYTGRRVVEVNAEGKLVHELRLGPRTVASLDEVR